MSFTDQKIDGRVRQFTYRTANVGGIFLIVPRDTVKVLEEQLAEAAGARMDNHTVYEVTQDYRDPVYIKFSDFTATFGSSVVEGRW